MCEPDGRHYKRLQFDKANFSGFRPMRVSVLLETGGNRSESWADGGEKAGQVDLANDEAICKRYGCGLVGLGRREIT